MKAVCVTDSRALEVREVPTPANPPSGHILVAVEACAINDGDKTFLARPLSTAGLNTSLHDIWGASAAGTVLSLGPGVPAELAGKRVAVYRSLTRSPQTVGLWSERAMVPWTSCAILPDGVSVQEYSGSLVNLITAYAFLEEMAAEGHKGVVVTAGNSATGLAMAALTRNKNIPAIFLARSEKSREELRRLGVEHVLSTSAEGFETELVQLAEKLQATAVFDGVGGELISRIVPHLPMNSTISFYGLLAGPTPISVPSAVFLMKNLAMKRFSNFNSGTVKDIKRLAEALTYIQGVIADPPFRTKIGETFSFEQIEEAMAYEPTHGSKAILVTNPASGIVRVIRDGAGRNEAVMKLVSVPPALT
ncbi:MAG: zinc-binding dehydrogenase [Terriglobia bacterium]